MEEEDGEEATPLLVSTGYDLYKIGRDSGAFNVSNEKDGNALDLGQMQIEWEKTLRAERKALLEKEAAKAEKELKNTVHSPNPIPNF